MPDWREGERKLTCDDMPDELRFVSLNDPQEMNDRRNAWLEANDIPFIDFISWRRAQDPAAKLRPPARRKLMTAEQLAEFDREREEEGDPRW